jgi:pimeloyl-ACP methyl ester carboxylesterase
MHKHSQQYVHSFDGEPLLVEVRQNHPAPVLDLVFVHGLTGDSLAFHQIVTEMLAAFPRLRCITYDLRGHGHSSRIFPSSEDTLISVLTKDLEAICTHLKVRHPIMVGQSLFGLIIQEYLGKHLLPRPAQVVLITPTLQIPALSINHTFWYSVLSRCGAYLEKQEKRKRQLSDHLKFKGSFDYSVWRVSSDMYFTRPLMYLLLWGSLFGSRSEYLSSLNSPTVSYLMGARDWIVPLWVQQQYTAKLPKAAAVVVQSNHNAIINAPEEIIPILIQVCHTEWSR